jgi:nucleoporin NUP82
MAANDEDDWNVILTDHPIFSLPESSSASGRDALELSTATLPKYTGDDTVRDGPTPFGRRQIMVLRDTDLIVAVAKELRICSLGDARHNHGAKKTFKVGVTQIMPVTHPC